MIKRAVLLGIFLLFILPSFTSATGIGDFENHLNSVGFYAKNYESGSETYPQLIIHLAFVEARINEVLRSEVNRPNSEQLDGLLEGDKTNKILSKDGITEIEYPEPVFYLQNKIIYDGKNIQVKLDLIPYEFEEGVVYSADLSSNFKDLGDVNFNERIEEVVTLSKTYSLSKDLVSANDLAEKSSILENLFSEYSEESYKSCEENLAEIFGGEEFTKEKREVIEKKYEFYSQDEYKVEAILKLSEDCKSAYSKCLIADINLIKNNQNIGYLDSSPSEISAETKAGYKSAIIESYQSMIESLNEEDYRQAYIDGLTIERLYILLDSFIKNQGTSDAVTEEFLDAISFSRSLFEGNRITSTKFKTYLEFEKPIFRVFEDQGQEMCDNSIDDNGDGKIDCADSLCTGQICGYKNSGNNTNETALYCISGTCREKEDTSFDSGEFCGDDVCQEGESQTCFRDCVFCPETEKIKCSGTIIYSSFDQSGCGISPTCIPQTNTCNSDKDCTQPLCGKSQCVEGTCKVTSLDQCSQSECTDGESKTSTCDSKEIVSETCINRKWKLTGEKCETESIQTTTTVEKGFCESQKDCADGMACFVNKCTSIPSSEETPKISETQTAGTGISFTGNVIQISSAGVVTGQPITGVVPDPESEELFGEVDESKVPQREYERGSSSFLTGIINNNEDEVSVQDLESIESRKTPSAGIEEELLMKGVCDGQDSSLFFVGAGEDFGKIDTLIKRYNQEGNELAKHKLTVSLKETNEFEKGIESLPQWIFESENSVLANNAEDWSLLPEAMENFYQEIVNNQKEIAQNMEKAGIVELTNYNLINVDYKNQNGKFKYSENLDAVKIGLMNEKVRIKTPLMEFIAVPPKQFMKVQFQNLMTAGKFPGSGEEQTLRELNKGLTPSEINEIRINQKIKDTMTKLSQDKGDGFFDLQISLIDKGELVYNIYIRFNSENIFAKTLGEEETPPVDAKINVGFNEFYSWYYDSVENTKYRYTPDWNKKFNIVKVFTRTKDYIDNRLKFLGLKSSIEVSPSNSESSEVENLAEEIFFSVIFD